MRDSAGEVPAVEQLVPAGEESSGRVEEPGAEERRAEEGGGKEGTHAEGATSQGQDGRRGRS